MGVGVGDAVQSEHENSPGPNLEAEEELNNHGPIMTPREISTGLIQRV